MDAMPTDIYANKISAIIYQKENTIYTVRRIRFSDKFEDIIRTNHLDRSDIYRYFIKNTTPGTVQISLVPSARDNVTGGLKIWYIRNANRLALDADVCDIPEFVHFVMDYMKLRIYEKEGHPNIPLATRNLERQRQLMTSTLKDMVVDYDTEVEKDLTFYTEMV